MADLKFDRLIGTTLFEVDTVHGDLPPQITARPFDAIVGNPPWTFVAHASKHSKRKAGDDENVRPRRSPDQEFLWVAARLAGDSGRIGMIMKATPFFARDQHAVNARQALLRKLKPAALVNLSALRKEELFPDATGPALLFFARCSLVEQGDRLLVGSIPWTPDFRRNGVFHVGPEEFRTLPLARVLQTPAMLKAWTFGTARDGWLIEKLERTLPTLDQVLTRAGILALKARGQGFQVEGDLNEPPKHYYDLKELTPSSYSPFRTDESRLVVFEHPTLHRPREASIFRGPLLVCPKASFRNAAEPGRYSATVIRRDMLYTESFYGISFANHDATWANIISAILNSSMATFQFAFGGGGWGFERPTVEPKDLLSLRVPDLALGDSTLLESVIHAEQAASGDPNNPRLLEALDRAVFALYALERDEKVIVRDSVNRAKLFLFEGRAQRAVFIRPPSPEALTFYATETVSVVNAYLRARGKRHLEALVYPEQARGSLVNGGPLGITAVRFAIVTGAPSDQPIINQGDDAELNRVTALIRGQVNVHIPPYLNERRQLRIYDADDLFVLKPSEARYWTRTAGSVSERTIRCGKPNCACATDDKARHGPCFSHTQAVEGKTRSRFLNAGQAALARQQVEAGREFRQQVDTYWEACEQWSDSQLDVPSQASSGEAKKKGSKRTSKATSSGKSKRS